MAKVFINIKIGTYNFVNGEVYDGEWKDGNFNGNGKENLYLIGIFKYSNGNKYDGNWKMNKKDGDGTPINIYRNILL